MNNYLLDKNFLLELDKCSHKEKYAKIIALDLDERPVEEISGKITGGSINIDGTSSVRRTCSLSLLAYDTKVTNFYWGLTNKFSLSIGLKNTINPKYPDIVWFKQGVYAITAFSSTESTNSYSISISGKDKMCYLNGDISGQFFQSIDLNHYDQISTLDNGEKIIKKQDLEIKEIIREMVHKYGGELFHNIIINDLDEQALDMMSFNNGNNSDIKTLTVLQYINEFGIPGQSAIDLEDDLCWIEEDGVLIETSLYQIYEDNKTRDILISEIFDSNSEHRNKFKITQYSNGEAVGYRLTDLIYTGDLIAKPGETITSVLDKIKNMLGGFEYFYDLDGRFIFQRKPIYLNTAWAAGLSQEDQEHLYVQSSAKDSIYSYNFTDKTLLSSIANHPQINDVKNDFCVWGQKKGVTGNSIPFHMRYAIHQKPYLYVRFEPVNGFNLTCLCGDSVTVNNTTYYKKGSVMPMGGKSFDIVKNSTYDDIYDLCTDAYSTPGDYNVVLIPNVQEVKEWRELLYFMSLDYLRFNHYKDNICFTPNDTYESILIRNHEKYGLYQNGKTGYEQYYEDMHEFWRGIYNPNYDKLFPQKDRENLTLLTTGEIFIKMRTDKIPETVLKECKEYYLSLYPSERKDVIEEDIHQFKSRYFLKITELQEEEAHYNHFFHEDSIYANWNKDVVVNPANLLFWIDFLDSPDAKVAQFSIPAVGSRPKVSNDSKVKAINYKEVPNLIIYTEDEKDKINFHEKTGYTYAKIVPYMKNLFTLSSYGKTAKAVIDENIYEYAFGTSSISLTTVPIYYLEPNTRIKLNSSNTSIEGDYIINRITIPLTFNGLMSISAVKAIDKLY